MTLSMDSLVPLAYWVMLLGNWSEAIAVYRRAIELDPNCAEDKLEEEIAFYQQAIELHPEDANLYRELGVAQEKIGDIEGEIKSYQKAIKLDTQQLIWVYTTLNNLLQEQTIQGNRLSHLNIILNYTSIPSQTFANRLR